MINLQKGSSVIWIIIIIVLLIAGGFYYTRPRAVDLTSEASMNKAVAEKYGNNSAAINKQIKAKAQASFSGFVVEASTAQYKDGSYNNACLNARSFIENDIKKSLGSGVYQSLGITIDSFRTGEIVCKTSTDKFIITMPIMLEDGTEAKVCSTVSQLGFVGDADYANYMCIKNS